MADILYFLKWKVQSPMYLCCGRANDSMKKAKTFTNILQDYGRLKNVYNNTRFLLVVILFWHQIRDVVFFLFKLCNKYRFELMTEENYNRCGYRS